MSLWKFGNFEAEADFTDADFLENLDNAKAALDKQLKLVPKVGSGAEIVRAQVECFYTFFDVLFWDGAGDEIFDGKHSLKLCVEAADSLHAFEERERESLTSGYEKYRIQNHGNRQQRRTYQNNQKHGKKQYTR